MRAVEAIVIKRGNGNNTFCRKAPRTWTNPCCASEVFGISSQPSIGEFAVGEFFPQKRRALADGSGKFRTGRETSHLVQPVAEMPPELFDRIRPNRDKF